MARGLRRCAWDDTTMPNRSLPRALDFSQWRALWTSRVMQMFVALIVEPAALTEQTAPNVSVDPPDRGRDHRVAGLV